MIPVVRVNVRRAVGDARLLFVATAFPVLFILVTGLLAGSPKEPVGLVHPPARLLQLIQRTDVLKPRLEQNRATLSDDILRGRVVAGLVTRPRRRGPCASSWWPSPTAPVRCRRAPMWWRCSTS